jgi:hypothetical protein
MRCKPAACAPRSGRMWCGCCPANTATACEWHRALSDAAHLPHELHWIEAPDELCRARLRVRNETKPTGLYFGHVPEAMFDPVNRWVMPPSRTEGFNVIWHAAAAT